MLGYSSVDIICSEKRTVFRERSSRKTVSFEEQIMSKDKYQISEHIFAAKLRLLCLLFSGFKNWGISWNIPQF